MAVMVAGPKTEKKSSRFWMTGSDVKRRKPEELNSFMGRSSSAV
jgi:hypothetical protein